MANLGHTGYSMFLVGGILVVSPTETQMIPEELVEHELSVYLETASEENEWIEPKINWSICLYGTGISEDLQEGV